MAAVGRARENFELCYPAFVITGKDEKEWEQTRTGVSRQIAFYGSTPAYRGVLELHGWGGLQPELNALSKRGEWVAMGELITDEMLEEFAIVEQPRDVAKALADRFGGTIDRLAYGFPFAEAAERKEYLEALRAA